MSDIHFMYGHANQGRRLLTFLDMEIQWRLLTFLDMEIQWGDGVVSI